MQGGDEGPAFAVEAISHHHAEAEAPREQRLDDLDGQLGFGLVDIPPREARRGREEAEAQRKCGGAQHAVGIHRDDAVGQGVQVADVLAGHIIGGMPLLAIPGLIEAHDERCAPQRLAPPLQPRAAQCLHRPVGMGEKGVESLWVDGHRLAPARQGLTTRLGEQPQVQGAQLLDVPDIVQQPTILGALLIEEGHRRGSWAHARHGATSFRWPQPAASVPNMTDKGLVLSPQET